MKERPEFCTDEMLVYLDELRESGVVNMFGAGPFVDAEFPELSMDPETGEQRRGFGSSSAAKAVLSYWMSSFGERHPR